jgi:hypothetical protein
MEAKTCMVVMRMVGVAAGGVAVEGSTQNQSMQWRTIIAMRRGTTARALVTNKCSYSVFHFAVILLSIYSAASIPSSLNLSSSSVVV